jgi:hypothetical protein
MRKLVLLALIVSIITFASCGGTKPSLKLDKTTFACGEEIAVTFTAPNYPENAWVGIIPSDIPHGSESQNDEHDLTYVYLEKQTSGVLNFFAPGKPGTYDFRMHDTDDNGNEVTHIEFIVE